MFVCNKENKNVFKYLDAGDSCILMILGNDISFKMHKMAKNLYYHYKTNIVNGIVEVVPAYRSISVYYNPLEISRIEVIEWLQKGENYAFKIDNKNLKVRRLYIPVCFDEQFGFDLIRVADYHNISKQKVIEILCEQDYLNYFIGFMPGKPYLGGLPEALETPRLDVPRNSLPSGSVVIYGKQMAIFGIEQPSGANCIGRSPILIYDTRKEDPILLQMGDFLRFYPISSAEFIRISKKVEAMEYHVRIEYVRCDV